MAQPTTQLIMRKLELHSMSELVRYAIRKNIVAP
jgi:DNA-binding NarL/FixJ family response regulator